MSEKTVTVRFLIAVSLGVPWCPARSWPPAVGSWKQNYHQSCDVPRWNQWIDGVSLKTKGQESTVKIMNICWIYIYYQWWYYYWYYQVYLAEIIDIMIYYDDIWWFNDEAMIHDMYIHVSYTSKNGVSRSRIIPDACEWCWDGNCSWRQRFSSWHLAQSCGTAGKFFCLYINLSMD